MIRRFFLFSLLVFGVLALPASLKRVTRSFHVQRLFASFPHQESWEFASAPLEDIRRVLLQEFRYLNRGAQSFVFISADRQFILKLFLFDANPSLVSRSQENRHASRILNSTSLACRYVPQETALVYAHLNLTSGLLPVVRLKGPAWHHSELNMDSCRFVLQKRATLMDEALKEAYLSNNRAQFLDLIDGFFTMLHRRASFGILNNDSTLFDNFGFIGNRAVEIDFGNYIVCPREDLAQRSLEERVRYGEQLLCWVKRFSPEWGDATKERVWDASH